MQPKPLHSTLNGGQLFMLSVDDDAINLMVVEQLLGQQGWKVRAQSRLTLFCSRFSWLLLLSLLAAAHPCLPDCELPKWRRSMQCASTKPNLARCVSRCNQQDMLLMGAVGLSVILIMAISKDFNSAIFQPSKHTFGYSYDTAVLQRTK